MWPTESLASFVIGHVIFTVMTHVSNRGFIWHTLFTRHRLRGFASNWSARKCFLISNKPKQNDILRLLLHYLHIKELFEYNEAPARVQELCSNRICYWRKLELWDLRVWSAAAAPIAVHVPVEAGGHRWAPVCDQVNWLVCVIEWTGYRGDRRQPFCK